MYGFYQSTYDVSLTTRGLNSPIFMLIVQLFDLLMLNLKYILHTTQKGMVTMARNFNSLTPWVGDVCDPTLFPCSGPFQWNIYFFFLPRHMP